MFPVAKQDISFTKSIFFITLLFLFLVLPFFFIDEKLGRIFFYLCSYLSLLGMLLQYKSLKSALPYIKAALPLLSLTALFFLWSCYAKFYSPPHANNGVVFTAAKRWFLASLIIIYVTWSIAHTPVSKKLLKYSAISSLFVAFIFASSYGLWEHSNGIERIILGIDRATMSAYAYSALALALLALISSAVLPFNKYPLIILVWLLSVYIISLTETRSAIFFHTLLSLIIVIHFSFKKSGIKALFIPIILVIIATVFFMNKSPVKSRIDLTKEEITEYGQGNDHTSLGSRFTLWKMGILTFTQEPFGQTQIHRNDVIKSFLDKNDPNSYALEYIDVHLHNEFIQYASLFGVFGIIILLYFYASFIFRKSDGNILTNPIAMITISAFAYGMTDVLLTSNEYIILFSVLYLLLNIINNRINDVVLPSQ
ncbi:O-antigen ligase family protein [Erwinia endophytica]|uniref:O-antigen ligase family protein n=1 Tax=Erwinia endophytica TaxID=1563158 RepID=UPI001265F880|nr:O-antigen ligase family protein [Erwinia endophytica]KAB8309522.1 O-antigen ligase family protein [Erwinia endophytica]